MKESNVNLGEMVDKEKINSEDSWVRELGKFIWTRGDIQALMLDHEGKTISFASLGQIDEEELKTCLRETILGIEEKLSSGSFVEQEIPAGLNIKKVGAKILLEKETCKTAPIFWRWREMPWPELEEVRRLAHTHEEDWRVLGLLAGICGFFGLTGYFFSLYHIGPVWLPYSFYLISVIAGGWDAMHDVMHKLPKGELDIHFLMVAVALGAVSIGAWKEGALLLFLFSLSGALEHFAKYRTRRAIDSLFQMAPETALIMLEGVEAEVPIENVRPGMIVLVKPGELFPVDAEIIKGETAVDESNLTGEANPINKNLGSSVFSGTINLWGVVECRVVRAARESSLQKIINLIQEAQHLKAPSQRFTDRFGTPYTYAILSLVTVMFFIWWLGFGVNPFTNIEGSYSAFYRAMTLLVVASPCALVLSVPSAILAAIAWGAMNGILFRGGAAIEKLSEIDLVALDKTGTLTTGDSTVQKVESFPPGRERDILEMAYSLEKKSTHPIARAIVAYGRENGVKEREVENFKSLTGAGVQGDVGEGMCVLGRRSLLELGPLAEWVKDLPPVAEDFTEVWVIYQDLIGRLLLKDTIRKESKPVLEKLRALKIKTVMLTGDRREAAESVGKELGIQEVRYGLSPVDKVNIIKEYTQTGRKVAMVGDGVNDAPCLAASYVPVSMGTRGSDAALEQSEVVLMNDRIDYFLNAYNLSLRAKRIIKINLVISLLSIGVMVLAGTFGLVPLTLGVITHEGSTVFVCLNSLRLLYMKS